MGELADIVGGGTPSTGVDSYWDGDIDWYAPAEIGEQVYLESSQRKITEEGLNKSSAKILPIGTVLFTSRAGIGKTAILLKESCTNQGFQSIVPNKEKLDSYFIFTRSEELKRYGEIVGAGSTFVEVSGKQMANMELMMPKTISEQQKIGKYFANLDNLITLHQRKYRNLRKTIWYAWEQRKVTELAEIYIGLVTTMTEHYTDKGHLLIRNSDIKDGYFDFGESPIYLDEEFSKQNKSRMHQLGDVITVHTGDIGTSAVIGENEVNSIGFATIVTRTNQEILDSNYFATYLNTNIHKQWAISMATGDGRSNYNLKDYTKLIVPIPQIEEQKEIASCISKLNNLITLHQRGLFYGKNVLNHIKSYELM